MFDNIGSKIKALAKVVCWIGIFGSIIAGIAMIAAMIATLGGVGVLLGLLTIVLGALLSWVGSFVLYGFGEMVENSEIRTELAVKAEMGKKEE